MAWPKSQRISQLRFQSLTHAPALLTRGLLERQLADANVPPAILHREMVTFYLQQISALHKALQNDAEATQDHCSNVVIRIGSLGASISLRASYSIIARSAMCSSPASPVMPRRAAITSPETPARR
jgi:hypothetical protein